MPSSIDSANNKIYVEIRTISNIETEFVMTTNANPNWNTKQSHEQAEEWPISGTSDQNENLTDCLTELLKYIKLRS